MNRFDLKRHLAFFDPDSLEGSNVSPETSEVAGVREDLKNLEREVLSGTRRSNEAMATGSEAVDLSNATYENLARVLRGLAKNRKVNLPWTNDEWKCSSREIGLATASAKVFQQLVDAGSVQKMIDLCKNYTGTSLTDQDAEQRKSDLGINSKVKDIKCFYTSYREYQSSNTRYEHLKGLMGFFFEKGIESVDDLVQSLSIQSKKITNTEIYNKGNILFRPIPGRNTYFDGFTRQEVSSRPSDWREKTSFMIIRERLESEENKNFDASDKMLALLSDFNLDGEINSGDVGYKTGSELSEVFRRVVGTVKLENPEFSNDKAVQNLVAYADKFGLKIPASSSKELYQWMTKWPEGYENTRKLQNFVRNLPIDFGDVLRNGADAGQESLVGTIRATQIEQNQEQLVADAAMQQVRQAIEANKSVLEEAFPDENDRRNVTQQLLSQLPGALVEQAINQQGGLALGHEIPLDQIIKGSSIGFNIGVDGNGKPSFGLFAGWDHKWVDGKQDYSVAVDLGGNFKLQDFTNFKGLFIPLATISAATGRDINEGQRNATLDATGLQRVEVGGNIGVVAIAGIPQLMWGAHVGYESDKQKGIESQAENIHGVIERQAQNWMQLLSSAKETTPDFDDAAYLRVLFRQQYPNSSQEALNTAADNLYGIIAHFKIDENTTEADLATYARVIADVFTDQWRNEALQGIADNKVRISGGKIGVEFFNIKPTIAVVAKFTRYRNARTVESDNSIARRVDARVNGTGNRSIDMGESKRLGASQVNQINDLLKNSYGAKEDALKYFASGEDGKPGKIRVPASLVRGVGINVRVSQSLKGCVQVTEGELYYIFPANTVYRLFQETGGSLKSVTLNIGSDRDNESDVLLSDAEGMKSLLGTQELMGDKRYEYVDGTTMESGIDYRVNIFDELFTPEIVEGLKRIDSNNRRRFSEFMRTKKEAVNEFNDMVKAIKDVLGNNPKYKAIVDKLSDPNTSDEDKQLIMDRIMTISAYANVHDKSGLDLNVRQRGNRYKESGERALKGPNGQSIFDKLKDVNRDEFIKGLDNYDPQLMPDIIGTTAFYHKNNTSKGLALTGLGVTTALGGKTESLSENDSKEADKWFLGGDDENGNYMPGSLSKEKSPQERNNVKRVVKSKIRGVNLEDADLKDLLKGKEREFTLDNSGKKIKVKMGKEYVFYLMGECANESIGLKLNISIQEQTEVQDYSAGGFIVNDVESSNRVQVTRKDTNVGFAVSLGKKEDDTELADTDPETIEVPNSTPENPGDPIDPNDPNKPKDPDTGQPPVAPENPDGGENQGGGRKKK